MEREEKIAYWLFTNLLNNRVQPSNINGLDKNNRSKILIYANLVHDYDRLIPRNILQYGLSYGITPEDLKKYSESYLNIDKNDTKNVSELGVSTIKILLSDIDRNETVEVNERERGILSPNDIKRLERFIFGDARERRLYEGCDTVCGYINN